MKIILTTLMALALCGCNRQPAKPEMSFHTFDTVAYGTNRYVERQSNSLWASVIKSNGTFEKYTMRSDPRTNDEWRLVLETHYFPKYPAGATSETYLSFTSTNDAYTQIDIPEKVKEHFRRHPQRYVMVVTNYGPYTNVHMRIWQP